MQQDIGLNLTTRRTRKEVLLGEMALVMPWVDCRGSYGRVIICFDFK